MRRVLFACVAVLLAGCVSTRDTRQPVTPGPSAQRAGRGVTLEMRFEGLIAHVDRTDQSPPTWWALMVDARRPGAANLPPCAQPGTESSYPAHVPGIVIEGAVVTGGVVEQQPQGHVYIALDDEDVTIEDGVVVPQGARAFPLAGPDLAVDLLANEGRVAAANTDAHHFTPVAAALIAPDHDLTSGTGVEGDALAARVRLTGANTVVATVHPCQPDRLFSFNASSSEACEANPQFVQLAEQVLATRTNVSGVTLWLRRGAAERHFDLAPAVAGRPIRIAFRNELPDFVKRPIERGGGVTDPGCPHTQMLPHFEVYRWFHLLTAEGAATTGNQCLFIPCVQTSEGETSGSPICPGPIMSAPPGT